MDYVSNNKLFEAHVAGSGPAVVTFHLVADIYAAHREHVIRWFINYTEISGGGRVNGTVLEAGSYAVRCNVSNALTGEIVAQDQVTIAVESLSRKTVSVASLGSWKPEDNVIVLLDPGIHNVGAVNLNGRKNVVIRGASAGSTIKSSATGSIFQLSASSSNIVIERATMSGGASTDAACVRGNGIAFRELKVAVGRQFLFGMLGAIGSSNVLIQNCDQLQRVAAHWVYANGTNWVVKSCRSLLGSSGENVMRVNTGVDDNDPQLLRGLFWGLESYTTLKSNCNIRGGRGIDILGCTFTGTGKDGQGELSLSPATVKGTCRDVVIRGCTVKATIIKVGAGTYGALVEENTIDNTGFKLCPIVIFAVANGIGGKVVFGDEITVRRNAAKTAASIGIRLATSSGTIKADAALVARATAGTHVSNNVVNGKEVGLTV